VLSILVWWSVLLEVEVSKREGTKP